MRPSPVILCQAATTRKFATEPVPAHKYNKDGAMQFTRNASGDPDAYYERNSFNGPRQDPAVKEPPLRISGDADRYNYRAGYDDHREVAALFQHHRNDAKRAARDRRTPAHPLRPSRSRLRRRCPRSICAGRRLVVSPGSEL
jgi:hypothetical protein